MKTFFGREYELSLISEELKKPSASILVYGKRKVGKTTLIKYALRNNTDTTVYYECIKGTMQDNVSGFVAELARCKVIPFKLPLDSFVDVFAYLNSLNQPLNIIIDEYPYLKEMTKPQIVDSLFQSVIDNNIGNIHLFLSGSHIGMMKDLLKEKNALYGRFSLTLQLKELNYIDAANFYPQKTVYDKVAFYSVFGGSPFVNEFIDEKKDLKANIVNTILNQSSPVYSYAEHILISDFSNQVNAERIMYAVANGKKKYGEIEEMLNMKNNGLLSKQLTSLLDMEIITKTFPINRQNDKKKISYELNDNLMRFYYAFVYSNKSALAMLGPDAFYDEYIEKPLITFISHRFEEQCRNYFSMKVKAGDIKGVKNIGTYYYDDSVNHTNGEFDVVLQRSNCFDIYEVKYHSAPLKEKDIIFEAKRIMNIPELKIGRIGFVSVSGFEKPQGEYERIEGKSIYDIKM